MEHKYSISGMSCTGCVNTVKEALEKNVSVETATVNLDEHSVTIKMTHHIELSDLQESMKDTHYQISAFHENHRAHENKPKLKLPVKSGIYYCPMHCEGEKTYSAQGNCPVCGMDLILQASLTPASGQFTCPMHPEVVNGEPGACPKCGMDLVPLDADESEEMKTYMTLRKKFWIATVFTVPIFIIAMVGMYEHNPLLKLFNSTTWNWIQFGLTVPVVFYASWMFFQRAYSSIVRRSLNMFTLIGIGAGVGWLFSLVAIIAPSIFPDQFKSHSGDVHVYFEATAVILTLVLLGQLLEAKAHSKTNSAVKALLKLAPSTAVRIENGKDHEIAIDQIELGDFLRVKPGDKIPVDGSVTEGQSSIDESMISGEPVPVTKNIDDTVRAGTINGKKSFVMKAEKVGADTLLSQIIHMVNNASRSKAPIQKLADKISGYFVPIVLLISIITFSIWAIFGPEPKLAYAFVNAIAVLIIACPCALGLATPMSVMVGVGKAAQLGVLIKDAESLEKMNSIDTLIIDKTGTVTEGKPSVEEVYVKDETLKEQIISHVASINSLSEHPLAEATVNYAKSQNLNLIKVENFESITGKGVKASIDSINYLIGNSKLMIDSAVQMDSNIEEQAKRAQLKGKTVPFIAIHGELVGCIIISDAIKPSSQQAIKELQEIGIKVIMMTGDNANTAKAVSEEVGITEYYADCLPEQKMQMVEQLKNEGKQVAMAGDGINDAPALALADIGIAMGTGTDVAIESASITLVKGDINGIVKARLLSHKVMNNIKQNLFFAMIYNTIGIPVAAGALFIPFNLLLSPMIAALAMSFSSVSVIANALRLRRVKISID